MSTVPQDPNKVRADQIHTGAILPLDLGEAGLVEVAAVTTYTDSDGAYMAALTVVPMGGGEPQITRFRAGVKLELATDAEIADYRDGERRRDLAAALVELAERIERKRLPLPPSYSSYPDITVVLNARAELEQWAVEFGATVTVSESNRIPSLSAAIGPLTIRAQSDREPIETPTEESSPSVAGAKGGTDPAAPSGPGGRDPGPDTTTAAEVAGDDTTSSADATSDDPGDRVDGPTSRAVRADAVPVAPPGEVGATGITPHRTPRGYDPMPTCIYRAGTDDRTEFHAKYASDLDELHPGWHWDGTEWMSSELRNEAMARRRADGMERPYKCDGCGKTSRLIPHEPGCPVDAAWVARNKQNGSGQ